MNKSQVHLVTHLTPLLHLMLCLQDKKKGPKYKSLQQFQQRGLVVYCNYTNVIENMWRWCIDAKMLHVALTLC